MVVNAWCSHMHAPVPAPVHAPVHTIVYGVTPASRSSVEAVPKVALAVALAFGALVRAAGCQMRSKGTFDRNHAMVVTPDRRWRSIRLIMLPVRRMSNPYGCDVYWVC